MTRRSRRLTPDKGVPARRGIHFGDNANSGNAVLRIANANNAPSNSNTNIGSGLHDEQKKERYHGRESAPAG